MKRLGGGSIAAGKNDSIASSQFLRGEPRRARVRSARIVASIIASSALVESA